MDLNHRSLAYETSGDDQTPPPRNIRATQFVLLYAVCHGELLGRSTRIRTLGPCVPNAVLYQTELHSELFLSNFHPNPSATKRTNTCWNE